MQIWCATKPDDAVQQQENQAIPVAAKKSNIQTGMVQPPGLNVSQGKAVAHNET